MNRKEIILEKVEREVENLTPQEQLKLLGKIADLLRKNYSSKNEKLNWTKLYGLGKNLWNGEDAQSYIDRLREDRK